MRIAGRQQWQRGPVDLLARRDRDRESGLLREVAGEWAVDDAHRDDPAPPVAGPQAAADHLRKPHQQLFELALGAGRARQHVRVAVALASLVLEASPLEA